MEISCVSNSNIQFKSRIWAWSSGPVLRLSVCNLFEYELRRQHIFCSYCLATTLARTVANSYLFIFLSHIILFLAISMWEFRILVFSLQYISISPYLTLYLLILMAIIQLPSLYLILFSSILCVFIIILKFQVYILLDFCLFSVFSLLYSSVISILS